MDIILEKADELILDCLWSSVFPPSTTLPTDITSTLVCPSRFGRDELVRQAVSIYFLTFIGIFILYFTLATLSYYFFFDHRMMDHPRFLKNQIRLEIRASLRAFAPIDALSLPQFLAEVRGHSRLYENVSDIRGLPISRIFDWLCQRLATMTNSSHLSQRFPLVRLFVERDLHLFGGWTYVIFSCVFFLWFTDFAIYLIHRWEHTPAVYKRIHKAHHKWAIPSPFASYAFHPIDGYLQSVPYHIFVFLFPLHKRIYLGLFVFVTLWTILIHDSELIVDHPLERIINGPSHHTLHHLHFTCNYGQYFTWADRLGKTYRHPIEKDHSDLLKACERKNRWRHRAPSRLETLIKDNTPSCCYLLGPSSSSSSNDSHHSSERESSCEPTDDVVSEVRQLSKHES